MLHAFAAKLSRVEKFSETFRNAKINLSLLGLGLEMEGVSPIADDETAVSRMLESIRKKGNRVLVTVDEVTNNENVRKFAAAFQIFIRAELPIFLLMTGLFENIDDLRNQKSLTFLYRAPRIQLEPLNGRRFISNGETDKGLCLCFSGAWLSDISIRESAVQGCSCGVQTIP